MPVKKAKKTGGRKSCRGGALTQSGRGFLGDLLPFPMNKLAGMVGLGKKRRARKMHGGGINIDPKEYVSALISTLGPIIAKDLRK